MAEIPTPETVALVRRRYREDATLREISAESGVTSQHIIYRCLAGEFPDGSGELLDAIPLRRPGRTLHRGSRASLVARMWHAAERQVADIEERMVAAGLEPAERESNTRMLAVVARTLRELNAVVEAKRTRKDTTRNGDDESPPRNIEELRQALAQKLEVFVARAADDIPDDTEGG
jgi:hypothetical protein